MTNREKVIKGLECHMAMLACNKCPYYCGDTCSGIDAVVYDTLALLKAQEPRLVTEQDFESNPNVDHDGCLPAWIEYRRDEDWGEYWEDQPDEWGFCKEDSIVYESMRYWTSRPDEKRRAETPWESVK